MKYLFSILVFAEIFLTANAQSGKLDKSFGINGVAITGDKYDYCYGIALQNDGKIIQAGTGSYQGIGGFLLMRYNSDGTLDASFGKEGRLVTDFSAKAALAYAVALQTDGKIIAAGYILPNLSYVDIALVRYMPDGSIDSSFGENGIVITDLGKDDYVKDMKIQSDGKIIVTGTSHDENENYTETSFVIRYLPDGKPDESFGDKGIVIQVFTQAIEITSLAVQNDGKILSAGRYFVGDKFLILRFLPDGSPDPAFGVDGIVTKTFEDNIDYAFLHDINIQPDDKIIATGFVGFENNSKQNITVVRFEKNGTADIYFGDNGTVITEIGSESSEARTSLVQQDGKIIAAGRYFDNLSFSYLAIVRYQINGILDTSFGKDGMEVTAGINGSAVGKAAALQEDGKILVGGDLYIPGSRSFLLARYFGGDAVLAAAFKEITAEQNTAGITLNWQTLQETNNTYFIIERSATAAENSYTSIAEVRSTGAHQYSYTDRFPLAGANYYRIKQAGADGQYSYSATVHIDFAGAERIKIYPNSAGNLLTVQGLVSGEANKMGLYDMQGRLLQQFTAKSSLFSVDVSRLAAGMYMLRVENRMGEETYSFVKQ